MIKNVSNAGCAHQLLKKIRTSNAEHRLNRYMKNGGRDVHLGCGCRKKPQTYPEYRIGSSHMRTQTDLHCPDACTFSIGNKKERHFSAV